MGRGRRQPGHDELTLAVADGDSVRAAALALLTAVAVTVAMTVAVPLLSLCRGCGCGCACVIVMTDGRRFLQVVSPPVLPRLSIDAYCTATAPPPPATPAAIANTLSIGELFLGLVVRVCAAAIAGATLVAAAAADHVRGAVRLADDGGCRRRDVCIVIADRW